MKNEVFAGRNITLVFDLTASDLNKIFSSDATPVLSYFKVNGKPAGKAFEAKLSEVVNEYFGDESFFAVFKLDELLNKVLTDKRMDDIFGEMSLDFSDVKTSIKDNMNLDGSYCDVKKIEDNIGDIKNQINGDAVGGAKIINFQDMITKVKDSIMTDDSK